MANRVLCTGLGFVTCLGNDKDETLRRIETLDPGLTSHAYFGNESLPVKTIGKPRGFDVDSPSWRRWTFPSRYPLESSLLRGLPPHGVYAACAALQGIEDARLDRDSLADGETGIYCASAGSPLLQVENLNRLRANRGERGNPMGVLASIAGSLNFNLGSWLGIRGSNCGYASACASGSHALGYALDDICLGRQRRALVVAAEDANDESLFPFASMRALSTNPDPKKASRPFDTARDGFVGAGGAVALILEEAGLARERGAPIYAEFAGWAQSSDGYHRASPHPQGAGLATAMTKALQAARVSVQGVDYLNAHATSTVAGDQAEAIAIQSVFAKDTARLPVSSIKGLSGHGLSMSGALEAAVCCLLLQNGLLLGNANLDNPDPLCEGMLLPTETKPIPPNCILNNSSGFGGSNVCHVIKRRPSA